MNGEIRFPLPVGVPNGDERNGTVKTRPPLYYSRPDFDSFASPRMKMIELIIETFARSRPRRHSGVLRPGGLAKNFRIPIFVTAPPTPRPNSCHQGRRV